MTKKKFKQIYISAKAIELRKIENLQEFRRITNGCGASGWKVDIVPDTIYGLSIRYECNNHDIDWHFAETWQAAILANSLMKKAVYSRIKSASWFFRGLRYARFYWYEKGINGDIARAHFNQIKRLNEKTD